MLGSFLVRIKLYLLEKLVESFQCNGKRCQKCRNVTENNTFTNTVDKRDYVINHSFNCNEKCIMFTRNNCKLQFVGESVGGFRCRWKN